MVQGITLDEVEEIVEEVNPEAEEKHLASSDYYWNSYAHFGIHEVRCLSPFWGVDKETEDSPYAWLDHRRC